MRARASRLTHVVYCMLFTVSLFNTRTHTQTHTLSKESEKESEEEDGDDENKRRLRGPNHPDDKVNAFLMIVLMIVSFLMIVCVYMACVLVLVRACTLCCSTFEACDPRL